MAPTLQVSLWWTLTNPLSPHSLSPADIPPCQKHLLGLDHWGHVLWKSFLDSQGRQTQAMHSSCPCGIILGHKNKVNNDKSSGSVRVCSITTHSSSDRSRGILLIGLLLGCSETEKKFSLCTTLPHSFLFVFVCSCALASAKTHTHTHTFLKIELMWVQ